MITAVAVGAGGLGAVLRYVVTVSAQRRWVERPIGTATVNVVGAIGLGLLVGSDVSGDTLRIAGTGLLGGFTTFSTWMVDSLVLAGRSRAHWIEAVANLVLVLGAGWVGYVLVA